MGLSSRSHSVTIPLQEQEQFKESESIKIAAFFLFRHELLLSHQLYVSLECLWGQVIIKEKQVDISRRQLNKSTTNYCVTTLDHRCPF